MPYTSKITTKIGFPITDFDISDYVLSKKKDDPPLLYDLFAISNHYGSLGGGHYTAYGYNKNYKKWYDFDDS
jgi:ubiquitin carboxyl-terminal hydrolase 4/11/15